MKRKIQDLFEIDTTNHVCQRCGKHWKKKFGKFVQLPRYCVKCKPIMDIFYTQLKYYNENKNFNTHFVRISDKQLMQIYWNGSWEFSIYNIEEPIKVG